MHVLVFDDLSPTNGGKSLRFKLFLNAAKCGQEDNYTSFPVKFGYMKVKKGQLIFVSNSTLAQLFQVGHLDAIKSRF